MKKVTKSIITSSLLALAFGAMSVGTTFALFTSQAKTTISVESGLIDLKAPISVDSAWELGNVPMVGSEFSYQNSIGGSITKDANNIVHLNKLAPGDGAIFALTPNNSGTNINIKARLVVTLEGELAGALNVEVKAGENMVIGFNGAHTGYTPWEEVEVGNNPTAFNVKVEFPDGDNGEILFGEANHDNQYQNKTATLVISYQAVQGNAQADDVLQLINTKLMSEAYANGKNETMYDALQDLSASQVAAIQERGYVWSVEEDQFYVSAAPAQAYKYFKMYTSMPDTQEYSIYAIGNSWTTVQGLTVGFDVGEATITSISYDRSEETTARTVVIRTNGGSLTINAPLDTVRHFGDADSLNIIAVAGQSYHENGYVAFAEIKTGRIALEKGAEVDQIHLTATDGVFDDIIVAKDLTVDMPEFSRDPVTIPAEGRLVVALQEGTEDITTQTELDYVWLTAVGIYEQVTVSESSTEAGNNYAVNSTNQEKKDTAQQIANNITASIDNNDYTLTATPIVDEDDVVIGWNYALESETVEDITESVTVAVAENVTTVSVAGEEMETTVENGLTEEEKAAIISAHRFWIDIAADDFAGGTGIENDPYLISTARELALLSEIMAGYNTEKSYSDYCDKYYKLTKDIDLAGKVWISIGIGNDGSGINPFKGHIDGNNKTISNMSSLDTTYEELEAHKMGTLSTSLGKTVAQDGLVGYAKDISIKDLYIVGAKFNNEKFEKAGFIVCCAEGDLLLENCHVDSTSEFIGLSNIGGLIGIYKGETPNKLIVKDCTVSATIQVVKSSNGRGAGFVGAAYSYFNSIYVYDSEFNGEVKGDTIGGFIGRSAPNVSRGGLDAGIHFINCNMFGKIEGTNAGLLLGYQTDGCSGLVTLDNCKYKINADGEEKSFTFETNNLMGKSENGSALWLGINGEIKEIEYGTSYINKQGSIDYLVNSSNNSTEFVVESESTLYGVNFNLQCNKITGKENSVLTITSECTGNSGNNYDLTGENINFYTLDGKLITKLWTGNTSNDGQTPEYTHTLTFNWDTVNSRWILAEGLENLVTVNE